MNSRDLDSERGRSIKQNAPTSTPTVPHDLLTSIESNEVRLISKHGTRDERRSVEHAQLLDSTSPGEVGHPELPTRPRTETKSLQTSPEKTVSASNGDNIPTAMGSGGVAEKPPWPEDLLKKYQRNAKLQDRYLIDQARLNHERATGIARYSTLYESFSRFASLSEPPRDGQKRPSLKRRQAAHGRLLEDFQAFEKHMYRVTELEQSLGNLEYKIAKHQGELLGLIGRCFKDDPNRGRAQSISTSSSRRSSSSPPMDPLEQQYFEMRGDVRLLKDKLHNHFSQPTTGLDGDTRSPETWQTEHYEMEQELQAKAWELRRLWQICSEAGLDVGALTEEVTELPEAAEPDPELPPGDENDFELDAPPFLPVDPFGYVPEFLKSLHWPERATFTTPKLFELANFDENRERITHWLGETTDAFFGPAAEPAQAVEFEHTISPPRSEPDWSFVHDQSKVHRNSDDQTLADFVIINASDATAPTEEPLLQQALAGKVVRRSRSGNDLSSQARKWLWSSPRAQPDAQTDVDLLFRT